MYEYICLCRATYTPFKFCPLGFRHPDHVWRRLRIKKLLITQTSYTYLLHLLHGQIYV
jgi:hypothetical protein